MTGAFSAKGYWDICNIICGLYAIINLEISLLWVWCVLNPTAKAGPDQRILGLYTAPGRMSSPLHPQGTTCKACTCWSKHQVIWGSFQCAQGHRTRRESPGPSHRRITNSHKAER